MHCAETLRLWHERFTERAAEVDALGIDETFRRPWTFCLAYSEAGLRAACLDVQQYLFTKEGTGRDGPSARHAPAASSRVRRADPRRTRVREG